MGVTGAGEIATGGKLGPIAADASVTGQAGARVDSMVVTQDGGRRRHRKRSSVKHKRSGTKHKRSSVKHKRSSVKHKRRGTTKRRSSKRKSRKH